MKCSICGRNFKGNKTLEKWKEEHRKKIEKIVGMSIEKIKVCGNCLDRIERGEI